MNRSMWAKGKEKITDPIKIYDYSIKSPFILTIYSRRLMAIGKIHCIQAIEKSYHVSQLRARMCRIT